MLDPRRLRVLREVAARGSFAAAAEVLSFTQSAVSQQIAALERESGTRLLERTHLLEDPFDLVVPDGHRLAGRASVALEELADETWIGGAPDSAYGAIVLHGCQAAGFEPRFAFGSDDYNAVQAFVAVGLGIAVLPHLALVFMRPGLH